MARVEITLAVLTSSSGALVPSSTATVYVYERGTTDEVSVYAAASGGSPVSQPLTCVNGRIEGWVEAPASLDLDITDGVSNYVQAWEAVSATGAGGFGFNVTDPAYGATGDGSTDDLTAINAAIAACQTAGGGTVYFPAGTYYCSAPLTFPRVDTPSPPGTADDKMYAMRLVGDGAWSEGSVSQQTTPQGGTILKIADGGVTTGGKLTLIGAGQVEVTAISFMEPESGGALPFIYCTSTVPKIHHCAFWGHSSKNGSTCTQDAIVLGGLGGGTSPVTDGTYQSPFQGYTPVIDSNNFHKITRAVYARTWANAGVVCNNWIAHSCGGGAGAVAVEILGISTSYTNGWHVHSNAAEMIYYTYFLKATYANENVFGPNGLYDAGGSYVAGYRFESTANYNLVIESVTDGTALSEHATVAGRNMLISPRQAANAVTIPQDSKLKLGSHADAYLYAYQDRLITPGSLEAADHVWCTTLGVGNYTTGYTVCDLGSGSVGRFALYDNAGALVGYVPFVPAGKFA